MFMLLWGQSAIWSMRLTAMVMAACAFPPRVNVMASQTVRMVKMSQLISAENLTEVVVINWHGLKLNICDIYTALL